MSSASSDAHEGVEALLESYYCYVDHSHKRLDELRDAVEDTEDMAEIYLDSQRNHLIKIDLLLSNGTLAVGVFSMVAGTFGMNLRTGWEADRGVFLEVCVVSALVCVALFLAVWFPILFSIGKPVLRSTVGIKTPSVAPPKGRRSAS